MLENTFKIRQCVSKYQCMNMMLWLNYFTNSNSSFISDTLAWFYCFLAFTLIAGLRGSLTDTEEQVSDKCNLSETSTFLEVWIFSVSSLLLQFWLSQGKKTLLTWTSWNCPDIRFNGHLKKKGISGLIKVDYEQKTLLIEVSLVFFCHMYSAYKLQSPFYSLP